MTIDAAEIARLRDNIAASPEQLGFMSADELLALLDELEKRLGCTGYEDTDAPFPDDIAFVTSFLTTIRAEATLAEKERCALRLDEEAKRHETAMDDMDPADRNEDAYVDHLVAATDFRSIAAAIRKGE